MSETETGTAPPTGFAESPLTARVLIAAAIQELSGDGAYAWKREHFDRLRAISTENAALAAEVAWFDAAHDRDAWQESDGDVLWWTWPVAEPPYVGRPGDRDFPPDATHWSRFRMPSALIPDHVREYVDGVREAKPPHTA